MAHRPHRQCPTHGNRPAARRRASKRLAPALIVLALSLALPASAAAYGASGNGRAFAVRAAQTSGLGTIVVDSQPTSADVRLDGVDAGLSTPATFAGVTPGDHQVSVSIPGFQPWQETVSVTADATTTVEAALLVALPATIDAEVTVTTTSDAIDGDVSNIAALEVDPGPDGAISLREAITAANATAGTKVIRFAPALEGAVITPGEVTGQPLLTLTGGDTWIVGDIDGDGVPDITLDGRLSGGISIWSSGVVVSGLRFVNNSGVMLGSPSNWTGPAKTLADDRLLGNSVDGSGGLIVGPLGLVGAGNPVPISNLTWSGLIFAGNQLSGGGISAYPGEGCAHDNHVTDLTIACNTVTDSATAIVLGASDTNTTWQGVPGPTRYADNNTLQGVTIEHNRCRGILYPAIHVYTADMGGSDCAISDVVIRDNDIVFTTQWGIGIMADAAELASTAGERACTGDSLTHVEISRNQIQGGIKGILVCAGNYTDSTASADAGGATDDVVSDVVVADNQIRDASEYGIEAAAGTAVAGASPCLNTTLSGLVVSNNLLANTTTGGVGIRLAGGLGGQGAPVTGNGLTGASLTDNTVQGFAQGIWISGGDGTGAVGNTLTGTSSGNSVSATEPWLIAADSDGASGNTLSFAAAELTPTITSFTPTSGQVGTSVTFTGTGFTFANGVSFNGAAATFNVVNDTQITATVPAGATGGTITVTTPGGTTTSTTSFTVIPFSSDDTLSNLTVSAGALSPSFTAAHLDYGDSVANNVSSITVTPTTNESHASYVLQVVGNAVTNPIALNVGANAIDIVVTAQNGASQTYSVTVTRAALVPKLTLKLGGLTSGVLKLGRSLTAKGTVRPISLAGGKATLTVQRLRSGIWRAVTSVARTISASGTYGWTYKPARRGSYRIRATIAKTAAHTSARTTWRRFKVT